MLIPPRYRVAGTSLGPDNLRYTIMTVTPQLSRIHTGRRLEEFQEENKYHLAHLIRPSWHQVIATERAEPRRCIF